MKNEKAGQRHTVHSVVDDTGLEKSFLFFTAFYSISISSSSSPSSGWRARLTP